MGKISADALQALAPDLQQRVISAGPLTGDGAVDELLQKRIKSLEQQPPQAQATAAEGATVSSGVGSGWGDPVPKREEAAASASSTTPAAAAPPGIIVPPGFTAPAAVSATPATTEGGTTDTREDEKKS